MSSSSKTGRIIIGLLLVLVLGVFLTKTYFINIYRIPQNGMYPTIKAGGLIFARLHPYKNISAVKRGDVIVCKQAEEGESLIQVLRVIGLPGDEIKMLGDTVTLNQAPLRLEQVRQEENLTIIREYNAGAAYEVAEKSGYSGLSHLIPANFPVPPNHLFLLGDNRSSAQDSRHTGPVRFEDIVGKKL